MPTRHNTTIRLSPQEREEIEAAMKSFGFTQLAPFLRFAAQKLRPATDAKAQDHTG